MHDASTEFKSVSRNAKRRHTGAILLSLSLLGGGGYSVLSDGPDSITMFSPSDDDSYILSEPDGVKVIDRNPDLTTVINPMDQEADPNVPNNVIYESRTPVELTEKSYLPLGN